MENIPNTYTLLQEIFNMFVSNDTMKPVLTKPFEYNGKIYATDGHILIRINKDACDFIVEPQATPPNCEAVVPTENTNLLLTIDKNRFEEYKTEDETIQIGEDIECKICDGQGQVEWEFQHYTNYFDCPVCDGDCYESFSTEKKTGNKIFGNLILKIKSSHLHINKFYKLFDVQDKLNLPIYLTHQSLPNKAVLFKIGICDILIMPVMISAYNDNDKIIDLNI